LIRLCSQLSSLGKSKLRLLGITLKGVLGNKGHKVRHGGWSAMRTRAFFGVKFFQLFPSQIKQSLFKPMLNATIETTRMQMNGDLLVPSCFQRVVVDTILAWCGVVSEGNQLLLI
jgi:hypothetical protein